MAKKKLKVNNYEIQIHLADKEMQYLSPQVYKGNKCCLEMYPTRVIIHTNDCITYEYPMEKIKKIGIKIRKEYVWKLKNG